MTTLADLAQRAAEATDDSPLDLFEMYMRGLLIGLPDHSAAMVAKLKKVRADPAFDPEVGAALVRVAACASASHPAGEIACDDERLHHALAALDAVLAARP